jgi:5-dehydro-2-deoxygluconokinase
VKENTHLRVFEAARANDLELSMEIDASAGGTIDGETAVSTIQQVYDLGIYPDWWIVRPLENREAWAQVCDAIARADPRTRGILIQGSDATAEELKLTFKEVAPFDMIKGFWASRAIIAEPARNWFKGLSSDKEAVFEMTASYRDLCSSWEQARVRRFRTLQAEP